MKGINPNRYRNPERYLEPRSIACYITEKTKQERDREKQMQAKSKAREELERLFSKATQ